MSDLLVVEGLAVELATPTGPIEVLSGVDLTLGSGDSLGLVGESGCGKSMTALAIMGLLPAEARLRGRIVFEGQDLVGAAEDVLCRLRGRRLAMVFQEPMTALNPVKTIGHQVAEGPRLHFNLSRAAATDRARATLDRVGLPVARFPLDLYPHQLSGGQRQRVVLAIALACEPALLIADEPTTALDVTTQARILALIAELAEDLGTALIMVSHDLGVVAETTGRTMVMYAGRIVEAGTTTAVFERLAHPYSRGLFAAIPRSDVSAADAVDGRRPRLHSIPGQVPDPRARPPGCAFAPRCHLADVRCRGQLPALGEVSADHLAACFHPVGPDQGTSGIGGDG